MPGSVFSPDKLFPKKGAAATLPAWTHSILLIILALFRIRRAAITAARTVAATRLQRRICLVVLTGPVPYPQPVSYTHLDAMTRPPAFSRACMREAVRL